MQSPSAAWRPWPICRGPVGLAETNSTCTDLPAPVSPRPKSSRWSRMVSMTEPLAASVRKKLMNPGPAISVFSTCGESGRAEQSFAARSRGDMRACFARVRAMLLARSPWAGSRVRSIWMSGSMSAGKSPALARSPSARAISSLRCCFIYRDHAVFAAGYYPRNLCALPDAHISRGSMSTDQRMRLPVGEASASATSCDATRARSARERASASSWAR